jgi:two-component system, sensor histidine kinase
MKNVNLLILDDKEENIISLSALLADVHHINIISSTDPNEALKICWKNDIAIALVDVQMPDINGFEFVSLLKSNPKTNHIMAIMVTAISKEERYFLKGLESGAIDYLYKPLNPEITVAKVTSFVNQIHIQEEIKQKNIALEESRKQLLAAKEDAEEARKSKEIFLANMSHEIRTPINGIIGIIHMLRNSELNVEQKDWIQRLDIASNSLLLIINDILDISKIDSGMMKVENESFSLRQKLEDIRKIFKVKALDKQLDFEMEIDPRLPEYVKSDPLRIQQIVNNFISNSLKFTETGTIRLKAEVLNQSNTESTIKLTVTDTGIGVKADAIDKIFLAFEQADATFEHAEHFPNEDKMDKKVFSKLEKFEDLSILIAEDNDLNSFMLAHMLESWGCKVDNVKNGRQAVEKVNQYDYDLIMMDTHMPIMSGFEAIKEIKKNSNMQKTFIPIITISASVLEHEQAAAYEAGADSVIGKPFDPLDLHQKISNLISKKRVQYD